MTKMEQEILEQPKALRAALEYNRDTVREIVKEAEERSLTNAYFSARGTSDHASIYGQYLLGVYKGITTGSALPSAFTLYGSQIDLLNSMVLGVSQSGQAADALAVLQNAREQGALSVAVTNDEQSPMAKAADYHLYCAAGVEESVAATKSFTTEMAIMAMLAGEWSGNSQLLEGLKRVPDAVEEFLQTLPAQLDKLVPRYRYMTEGFTLARGMSYPVALEAALKIQETNYIKMKGYATSDFYHGPLAQIDKDTPVILFAAQGPAFDGAKEMVEKLEGIGAEVIVVSDDVDYAAASPFGFAVPNLGSDCFAPFFFAVFAQLFACKLAVTRGHNPDAPRLLKKVTVTR